MMSLFLIIILICYFLLLEYLKIYYKNMNFVIFINFYDMKLIGYMYFYKVGYIIVF